MNVRQTCAAVAILAACAATAPQKTTTSVGEWNMTTDQLVINMASGDFSAPDHVIMTKTDGSKVEADRAKGNYKKKLANLYGHVSVYDVTGTFGMKGAAHEKGPATLTTDQLRLDNARKVYDAVGKVHYEQGDTVADATAAHLNDVTHQLDLTGPVHAVQGQRTLDAQHATYNTSSGDGEADGNTLLTFPAPSPAIATPKPLKVPGIIH